MSIRDFRHEFQRHKDLADRAMSPLKDQMFFHVPGDRVNSIALIVKHVAGNLRSRWTDFLTTDGEKADRHRDNEFVIVAGDSRASLMAAWESGWEIVLNAVSNLDDEDAAKTVTIRDEPHSVLQATIRSATHTAYHIGQIMYLARLLRPDADWVTIAPGGRGSGAYLRPDA
jgi:hypothetical protein